MRFTRPTLAPLNIDLSELRAVGNQPARFEGVTSEGRKFEGRYRNGWLQLNYLEPDEIMIEARIGDAYDMEILPEQICDLVGLTIQGKIPLLTCEVFEAARREFPIRDWSGATTYYSINLEYTQGAGLTFLSELETLIPGTFVNYEYLGKEQSPSSGMFVRGLTAKVDLWGTLHIGAKSTDDAITRRLHREYDRGIDQSLVIGLKMPLDTRSREYDQYDSAFASKSSGRIVHIHPTFRGRITGEIKTNSQSEQCRLEEIEALVARHFFNTIRVVDIETGELVECRTSGLWYSLDLAGWCDPKKMKFLGATSQKEKTRPVGYLPDLDAVAAWQH